jgi:hypothetical protein
MLKQGVPSTDAKRTGDKERRRFDTSGRTTRKDGKDEGRGKKEYQEGLRETEEVCG